MRHPKESCLAETSSQPRPLINVVYMTDVRATRRLDSLRQYDSVALTIDVIISP